jgi:hypothetical protein
MRVKIQFEELKPVTDNYINCESRIDYIREGNENEYRYRSESHVRTEIENGYMSRYLYLDDDIVTSLATNVKNELRINGMVYTARYDAFNPKPIISSYKDITYERQKVYDSWKEKIIEKLDKDFDGPVDIIRTLNGLTDNTFIKDYVLRAVTDNGNGIVYYLKSKKDSFVFFTLLNE